MLRIEFPLEIRIGSVRSLGGVIECVEQRGVDGEFGELIEVEYGGIVVSVVSSVREHVFRQEAAAERRD